MNRPPPRSPTSVVARRDPPPTAAAAVVYVAVIAAAVAGTVLTPAPSAATPPSQSPADVLLTLDGRLFEGRGRLEGRVVVFVPRTGPAVRLPLDELLLWRRGDDAALDSQPAEGLRLHTGETVPGRVESIDLGRVELSVPGDASPRRLRFPLADVRDIFLQALPPDGAVVGLRSPLAPGFAGVVLAQGDAVEGELLELTAERIVLSSVLFGQRRFPRPGPVVSVHLPVPQASARPAPAAGLVWRVHLAGGIVLDTDRLEATAQGDRLRVRDRARYAHDIGTDTLLLLYRRGVLRPPDPAQLRGPTSLPSGLPARLTGNAPWTRALTDLPTIGDATRYDDPAAGSGAEVPTDTRCVLSGQAGTLHLEVNGADALFCRLGLPEGLLPHLRARFVVELDGQRVAVTPTIRSIDPPLRLGLRLTGTRTLSLRVEAVGSNDRPIEGVVDGLVLVHPR